MSRMAIGLAFVTLTGLPACTVINDSLLSGEDGGGTADARDEEDARGAEDAPLGSDAQPSSDAAPAFTGLAVHYKFEGTGGAVMDSSGRDFHGALNDIGARTSEGRVGNGIALAGGMVPTQWVSVPSGILENVDDFTVTVWVKLNTIAPWSRIYDFGNGLPDPANRFMYLTPSGNGGLHAASYGGSAENESTLTTGTQLPTGVWKHLALTGHGGDRVLYIDGFPAAKLEGSPDVPPLEMEPLAPASWLGKSRFPADPGLDGSLDDFRVYGRVLSPTEIADIAWPQSDYSYWRFDETADDSSDRNVSTQLADGADWTSDGRLNQALDLSGGEAGSAGPHAVLEDNPLESCDEALTIAFWVKLRGFDDGAHAFDFGTSDDTRYLYLAPSDGTGMRFVMKSPSGEVEVATDSLPFSADDSWHHLAVTVNASNLVVLYVDGLIEITKQSPDVGPADFVDLDESFLGKSRFSTDPYLDGSIDELRISCRAFTADEIRNLSRP